MVAELAVQRRQQHVHDSSHLHDDFAVEVGLLGPFEGIVNPFEREDRVDDRMEVGCLHEPQQLLGLHTAGAADTDDGDLSIEDAGQIGARVARGRARHHDPSTWSNTSQAVLPCRLADGLDDEVDGSRQSSSGLDSLVGAKGQCALVACRPSGWSR